MHSLKHLLIGFFITVALSAGFLVAQSPAARQSTPAAPAPAQNPAQDPSFRLSLNVDLSI
jgi:hypothetical protein